MRFLSPLLPALALTFFGASASALSLSTYGIPDVGVGPTPSFSFSTTDTFNTGNFYVENSLSSSGLLYAQFYGFGLTQNGEPAQADFSSTFDNSNIKSGTITANVLNGALQSIRGSFFLLTTEVSGYNRRVQYSFTGLGYTTVEEYLPIISSDPRTPYSKQESTGHFAFALAPVPEPSTYALMLAGLAVVGGVARRRRRSGAVVTA